MAHHVYILYSPKIDRYYIGNTDLLPAERLNQHNDKLYPNSFTASGIPWQLFLSFPCASRLQARRIESHIKKMKSRVYIQNLKRYPEIIDKLKIRYSK